MQQRQASTDQHAETVSGAFHAICSIVHTHPTYPHQAGLHNITSAADAHAQHLAQMQAAVATVEDKIAAFVSREEYEAAIEAAVPLPRDDTDDEVGPIHGSCILCADARCYDLSACFRSLHAVLCVLRAVASMRAALKSLACRSRCT